MAMMSMMMMSTCAMTARCRCGSDTVRAAARPAAGRERSVRSGRLPMRPNQSLRARIPATFHHRYFKTTILTSSSRSGLQSPQLLVRIPQGRMFV